MRVSRSTGVTAAEGNSVIIPQGQPMTETLTPQ